MNILQLRTEYRGDYIILDDITAAVYKRLADDMEKTSLSEMKKAAENMSPLKKKTFKEALRKSGMSFICEVKKASPSKGTIVDDFPYIEIAQEYEAAGADIIGVNNRNLKDFTVSLDTSVNLRRAVPKEIIFVAESGICSAEDISLLRKNRVDAVLIGESLMRSDNKKRTLAALKGVDGED